MTGNTLGWVIVAFVLYLLMMIAIGAFYAKGNNNSEDYFLGGRKLNGFVAALSAQASDMSGWLLMGLPGAIYLTGVGGDGWSLPRSCADIRSAPTTPLRCRLILRTASMMRRRY